MTLIKSPNRSWEAYWFCSVSSSSFLFLYFFFFLFKSCPHKFSVTIGRIDLKFGDMKDIIRMLCKRVIKRSNFKMADSKAPLRYAKICPFFSGWVLSNHWTHFFPRNLRYDRYGYDVYQSGSKGPCENMPHPFHFLKGLISQKPFRSPPINHIYSCSLWYASSDIDLGAPGGISHRLHFKKCLKSKKKDCSESPSPTQCIAVPYDRMHPMTQTYGPLGISPPLQFVKGLISQKQLRSQPLNHTYCCLLW